MKKPYEQLLDLSKKINKTSLSNKKADKLLRRMYDFSVGIVGQLAADSMVNYTTALQKLADFYLNIYEENQHNNDKSLTKASTCHHLISKGNATLPPSTILKENAKQITKTNFFKLKIHYLINKEALKDAEKNTKPLDYPALKELYVENSYIYQEVIYSYKDLTLQQEFNITQDFLDEMKVSLEVLKIQLEQIPAELRAKRKKPEINSKKSKDAQESEALEASDDTGPKNTSSKEEVILAPSKTGMFSTPVPAQKEFVNQCINIINSKAAPIKQQLKQTKIKLALVIEAMFLTVNDLKDESTTNYLQEIKNTGLAIFKQLEIRPESLTATIDDLYGKDYSKHIAPTETLIVCLKTVQDNIINALEDIFSNIVRLDKSDNKVSFKELFLEQLKIKFQFESNVSQFRME